VSTALANSLPKEEFLARYGHLFEHSPWVVERAEASRPFDDLFEGLMEAVHDATPEEQLGLIRSHPELAGKAAIAKELTAESTAEQASAGLDRLTPEEYDRFHDLNRAYRERFGFPFVICVRRTDKAGILEAMQSRLGNERGDEVRAALEEIGEIVRLRLEEVQ